MFNQTLPMSKVYEYEQISSCFKLLLLKMNSHGLNVNLSMSKCCSLAGIILATIYKYYRTKKAILTLAQLSSTFCAIYLEKLVGFVCYSLSTLWSPWSAIQLNLYEVYIIFDRTFLASGMQNAYFQH